MRMLLLKSFRIGQKNNKANYYLPKIFGTCSNLWNIFQKLGYIDCQKNNPGSSSENQIINFLQVKFSLFFTFLTNRDLPKRNSYEELFQTGCGWCVFTLRSVLARLGVDWGHPDAPTPPPPQSICPETTFETVCLRQSWVLSNGFTPGAWCISQLLAFPHLAIHYDVSCW